MTLPTIVELTPWFLPPIKPVREGVYIADFPEYVKNNDDDIWYAHFNGIDWGWMYLSLDLAVDAGKDKMHRLPNLAWRGLAKDPNNNIQTDDKPLHGDAYKLCTAGLLAVVNIVIWGYVTANTIFQ